MKKLIAIITAVLLISGFATVTSAHADRKTIEGFVLGTGVAILGAAILHEMNRDTGAGSSSGSYAYTGHIPPRYNPPGYNKHYNRHYTPPKRYKKAKHYRRYAERNPRGHWEVRKVWIAPVYEEKWNPGHYNRRGEWVSGRYQKFMIQEGYWSEKKVWVWY